eukprot:gnl/TRDRNA2_/TRDRNA2_126214_c0_seq1.p1 gnl/TRDRNA2_/TRDRNA2_126214_c0~~gnl/TRDRNA2_/TRDRNA2_126214_c0_seq1.p1  ORF type:complete len:478 (+),score=67.96 gnl/TRDRNA2_/TRDRNA2_126214_c0_seq1:49-1482(+)
MCSVNIFMISVLLVSARSNSQVQDIANEQNVLVEEVHNKLADRALKMRSQHHSILDSAILGKSGGLIQVSSRPSITAALGSRPEPWLRHSSWLLRPARASLASPPASRQQPLPPSPLWMQRENSEAAEAAEDEAHTRRAALGVVAATAAGVVFGSAADAEAKTSSTPKVPSVRLNDGNMMPVIAFGAQAWEDTKICESYTAQGIDAGYRFIWSAQSIGADCQRAQAKAIKASGIPRSEFFIAGTIAINCQGYQSCYDGTLKLAEDQLDLLEEEYLDMIMIQYPSKTGCNNADYDCICPNVQGQWDAFEEFKRRKKARTLAVSNFKAPALDCIRKPGEKSSRSYPAVNQKQYAVGHGKDKLVATNAKYDGIVLQSWSPLQYSVCLPEVRRVAKNRGKSASQVALRWILQRGATINIWSSNMQHLREDLEVFDWELSDDEMTQLNAVPLSFEGCFEEPSESPATAGYRAGGGSVIVSRP